MLSSVIEKISKEFLSEAISSPKLLADMAAMEKYMAESYSGRVFIELLQNADDCQSTQICVKEINGNIVFANNGRPFDENDVMAISRSGASNKERGKSIGYRGVGFKSTTYLTNEIIIYSDNTYFTFSKSICAAKIGVGENEIPMIRIPIHLETVDAVIMGAVNELVERGYNTVFVFRKAKISEFIDEMKLVDSDMFIFLNNIEKCIIEMKQIQRTISLQREKIAQGQLIRFLEQENNAWYIIQNKDNAIGFKFDLVNNKIVACSENEQVYHSYLPTYDKMAFPFKVNADFTTDPSRKHISVDMKTERAIKAIAQCIVEVVEKVFNGFYEIDFENIFSILNMVGSFSKCNSLLRQNIKELIKKNIMLPLQSGEFVNITDYKLLPEWLDESEKMYLRSNSQHVGEQSLSLKIYDEYINVDKFIEQFSDKKYSSDDNISIMEEKKVVEKMHPEMQGKMIGKIIKSEKIKKITTGKESNITNVKMLTEEGVKSLAVIAEEKSKIKEEIKEELENLVSNTELQWFSHVTNIEEANINSKKKKQIKERKEQEEKTLSLKPHITKWRSAEQQCVEIEKYLGNKAEDVSKKNIGYDIESITVNGEKRLIEVKSIKKGGSFSMTNNEYTAAHQYGERYYVCLVIQGDNALEIIYIKNPLKNLNLEKRVKMWEWYCDDYEGESYKFDF